jgi:hypothetical protein
MLKVAQNNLIQVIPPNLHETINKEQDTFSPHIAHHHLSHPFVNHLSHPDLFLLLSYMNNVPSSLSILGSNNKGVSGHFCYVFAEQQY